MDKPTVGLSELRATEAAYLAGLFDGEGSVCILKREQGERVYHWLQISIGNTDKPVLAWVRDTFGGHLSDNAQRHTSMNLRAWRWRADCGKAAEVLEIMLPYLRIKREHTRLAIEFQARFSGQRGGQQTPVTQEVIEWREEQRARLSAMNLRHRPRV